MENLVKLGLIGLGQRGQMLLRDVILPLQGELFDLVAVCDLWQDRVEIAEKDAAERAGARPLGTTDYRDVLALGERKELDAVIVATGWEAHVPIAVDAMKAGVYVGLEVGGAYSVEDCFALVDTHEATGTQLMFLENCCYGKRELMALTMYRAGVMGEVVHCSGGYMHDLRREIAYGRENRHYRLDNYLRRNCENYPTHELGPIAKLLDVNNGNRMLTLSSTASAARGLHEFAVERRGRDDPLASADFAQGDVVTTVIRCEGGQTIALTLDTTLPRFYSRGFTVRGTKASYFGETDCVFIDSEHAEYEFSGEKLWGNAKEYEDKYLHPLWRNYDPRGGHDGMDWITLHAFAEAVRKNARPPIDVYDAAAYMCVTPLSAQSIALGGAPVEIPDFTCGKWVRREDGDALEYALDRRRGAPGERMPNV